jgi:hypothetical protein
VATTCGGGTCNCNLGGTSLCGSTCVDEKSDPAHCGSCTGTCPSGNCKGGACAPVGVCKFSGPYNILFYGPIGTSETPYLPATGGAPVVTTWDDATWRTKTTTDFKAFDLIIISEGGVCPAATSYQAAFDTQAQWSAAVTGHVVITEQDPVFHAGTGKPGAAVWAKAALAWAASGPGTGLYVAADCGNRGLDFLHQFSAVFHSIPGSGDTVTILDTTHPVMAGSTNASLSSWGQSFHGLIDTLPSAPPWETIANGTTTSPAPLTTVRNSACPAPQVVTFPSSGSTLSAGGTLGTGGASHTFFTAGTSIQESFARPDPISRLDLNFKMYDTTAGCAVGKVNTFDVKVNGTTVGSFSWTSGGTVPTDRPITLSVVFPSIAPVAGNMTLSMVATSTVCPGGSNWDWEPGGSASMQ